MKPQAFEYHRPASLDEALALLGQLGDEASVIAGGQSLVPMMNLRLAQPAHLVDLGAIGGLDYVREAEGALEVGAMTRHQAIVESELVRDRCPLLAEAGAGIAHYAIRQRGTIGGSLAHADPAAQWPLVAVALGARLKLRGPRGERELAAGEFFHGLMSTAIEPGELLVSVRFPCVRPGEGQAFTLFNRRHGDYAIVAAACTVELSGGQVAAMRLAVGAATPAPVDLREDVAPLAARALVAGGAAEIGAAARAAIEPMEGPGIDPAYRAELVEVMVERAVRLAAERAASYQGR